MTSLTSIWGVSTWAPIPWPASGNPTPTPGTPTAISDSTGGDYNAFPSAVVINTSTLVVAWRKGSDHNSTANGALVMMTKALGGSWSAVETVVAADAHGAGLIVTDPNLTALPDGRVLMVYSTKVIATQVITNWVKVRGSDGVWGSSTVMTTDFPAGMIAPGGGGVVDGTTVLVGMYGRAAASGLRGAYLYQADVSDLTTWTQRMAVAPDGERNLDWEECVIRLRSDGLALFFIRDDNTKKIYVTYSPDVSLWAWIVEAFDGWARPNAGVNPSDDMLCIVRDPTDNRAVFSFSATSGLTYTASDYVDSNLGSMMYGSVVWIPGRGWVGVYSVAGVKDTPSEYTGPADLYEIEFT